AGPDGSDLVRSETRMIAVAPPTVGFGVVEGGAGGGRSAAGLSTATPPGDVTEPGTGVACGGSVGGRAGALSAPGGMVGGRTPPAGVGSEASNLPWMPRS